MRTTALVLILAACAPAVFADDTPRDYSQTALFKFARDFVKEKELEKNTFNFRDVGAVRIKVPSLGMRILMSYLPLLAPLPGTRLKDLATVPDPFLLTKTEYAARIPPRMADDEYRRVKDIGNP
jgi:hypothetical protein